MQLEINDLKNLSVLLQSGKWTLTAQESTLLLNLLNKINEEIKTREAPKTEESVTDNK